MLFFEMRLNHFQRSLFYDLLSHATCGFSPQQAASASERINFETQEKPDSVIQFFKQHGFSQTQVLNLIRNSPRFLLSDPNKSFLPKIEFLKSKGVLSSDILKIICNCPHILTRSLQNQIIPSFDFFQDLFQSDNKLIKAVTRCPGILIYRDGYVLPNIKLLREGGVPESHIIYLLGYQPRSFIKKPDRFTEIVQQVKKMGLNPLRFDFLKAVHAMTAISKSTWVSKVDLYKRWGWSEDEVLAAIVRDPYCMTVSEDKIEALMEFLVCKLGCQPSAIARRPKLLGLSLDKRIIPRGSVIQVLLSEGLVNKLTLPTMFESNERVFLERFVVRHEKEHGELLKLYRAKLDLAR